MNALISDILDEEILILALLNRRRKRRARRRRHRWWVHPIIRRRKIKGAYRNLVAELLQDEEKFHRYFRTTREQFTQILHHIEQDLTKVYKSRETIGPRERLAVALRFLATGESYASLAFQLRLGVSTISRIIPEVCNAIWNRMGPLYMRAPESAEQWKLISANFWQKWQFPFCLGAVDGKHIVMMKPWKSGSLYFNYKGTCSIVLMALVDANLQFIAIDTGSYGRNSDGGIFSRCPLGKRFAQGTFNFPPADHFPGFEHIGEVPYVAVGDEAFPLMPNLLRPFPGKEKAWDKEVFNYRLSRARRIVENVFGILAARWRVFHTKMAVSPKNANAVVKAACVLHNMLQRSSTPAMITTLLHDAPDLSNAEGLRDIQHVGYRGGNDAVAVRNRYKQFFSEDESCPWQYQHVRGGYAD